MTTGGRDHDLIVRDPDHGQTKGYLVLLLRSKLTPEFSFFSGHELLVTSKGSSTNLIIGLHGRI